MVSRPVSKEPVPVQRFTGYGGHLGPAFDIRHRSVEAWNSYPSCEPGASAQHNEIAPKKRANFGPGDALRTFPATFLLGFVETSTIKTEKTLPKERKRCPSRAQVDSMTRSLPALGVSKTVSPEIRRQGGERQILRTGMKPPFDGGKKVGAAIIHRRSTVDAPGTPLFIAH